jgi:hypothetical protein
MNKKKTETKTDKKLSPATIPLIIFFSGILIGGSLGYVFTKAYSVTEQQVNDMLTQFFDKNNIDARIIETTEREWFYESSLLMPDKTTTVVYISKDGNFMFPMRLSLNTTTPAAPESKSDKPIVELFVMSECPYGLQIEKGIIPVVKTLGNSIDFKVKFVNYAMHGEKEVTEQNRQYCIQQNSKNYLDYLACYVATGNATRCLPETKVDSAVIDQCMNITDSKYQITKNLQDKSLWVNGRFPKFLIHETENSQYGITGSPALVINGAVSQSRRDAQSLLTTVCNAFTSKPAQCNTQLSDTVLSAGFGGGSAPANSASQCG